MKALKQTSLHSTGCDLGDGLVTCETCSQAHKLTTGRMGPPFYNEDGTLKNRKDLLLIHFNACRANTHGTDDQTKKSHKSRICVDFKPRGE